MSVLADLRLLSGSVLMESFFTGISGVGRLHPRARPEQHGVRVTRNVDYGDSGRKVHQLDVYQPATGGGPGLLFVHGGGFRILSKDTHWIFGLAFARVGFTVFSINYRLAPAHPYPAALVDVGRAWEWVLQHAPEWDVDPERMVVAGESAVANLATALTVACCIRRPEPFAARIHGLGQVPAAAIPMCGLLQVTDVERLARRRKLGRFVADRLVDAAQCYLPSGESGTLADPLVILESESPTERSLPPFLVSVGTRDPLLDDSRRLAAALQRRAVRCDLHIHPGQVHAFQAFATMPEARKSWRAAYGFLDEVVPRSATT